MCGPSDSRDCDVDRYDPRMQPAERDSCDPVAGRPGGELADSTVSADSSRLRDRTTSSGERLRGRDAEQHLDMGTSRGMRADHPVGATPPRSTLGSDSRTSGSPAYRARAATFGWSRPRPRRRTTDLRWRTAESAYGHSVVRPGGRGDVRRRRHGRGDVDRAVRRGVHRQRQRLDRHLRQQPDGVPGDPPETARQPAPAPTTEQQQLQHGPPRRGRRGVPDVLVVVGADDRCPTTPRCAGPGCTGALASVPAPAGWTPSATAGR